MSSVPQPFTRSQSALGDGAGCGASVVAVVPILGADAMLRILAAWVTFHETVLPCIRAHPGIQPSLGIYVDVQRGLQLMLRMPWRQRGRICLAATGANIIIPPSSLSVVVAPGRVDLQLAIAGISAAQQQRSAPLEAESTPAR